MKIVSIIGARPQFIKAAVISRALAQHNLKFPDRSFSEILVHTGQHYDYAMSGAFLKDLSLPPVKYHFDLTQHRSHASMTGFMLEKLEEVLLIENPDFVVVYGDTNSTLAGALAAVKLKIPVAHVEAGLRSFNMNMPEEINRIITDRVSKLLFCPTQTAYENLEAEGVLSNSVSFQEKYFVGDVMCDSALYYQSLVKPSSKIKELIKSCSEKFYLATIHRAENTDSKERLTSIISALDDIATQTPVLLPLHPRTKNSLEQYNISHSHITMIDPIGYFDMLCLLDACGAVFTDSGGLQKEAYFYKKLCITLRLETEWIELVENGFNFLVGYERNKILETESLMDGCSPDWSIQLYGDGNAAEKIVNILSNYYNQPLASSQSKKLTSGCEK